MDRILALVLPPRVHCYRYLVVLARLLTGNFRGNRERPELAALRHSQPAEIDPKADVRDSVRRLSGIPMWILCLARSAATRSRTD
jgi:hypothetical protein